MRLLLPILLCILLTGMSASPLYAYGQYYVEIGGELEEEQAIQQWKTLSAKYPDTLGKLEFFPTTIVRKQENRVATHIQAGPLNTKLDAYRICGKLFEDNLPCFIIEGMQHDEAYDPARQRAAQEAPPPLPWLVKTPEAVSAQPALVAEDTTAKDEDFFDWVASGFSSDEGKAPTIESRDLMPKRQGKVEVAEAIRVPVGSEEDQYSIAFAEQAAQQTSRPLAPPSLGKAETQEKAGWISVKRFPNDDRASAFWQAVRARDPLQTAGLRVRIIRPLLASNPEASLLIGPFAGPREGREFCHTVIATKNDRLSCSFTSEDQVTGESTALAGTPYSHGERYQERREQAERKRFVADRPYQQARVYWLHVASAATQIEALAMWEKLRKSYPELLEGLRSSVSATLSKNTQYMLRIGPLDSGSAAAELCSSLQERKVPCRLYSNM